MSRKDTPPNLSNTTFDYISGQYKKANPTRLLSTGSSPEPLGPEPLEAEGLAEGSSSQAER